MKSSHLGLIFFFSHYQLVGYLSTLALRTKLESDSPADENISKDLNSFQHERALEILKQSGEPIESHKLLQLVVQAIEVCNIILHNVFRCSKQLLHYFALFLCDITDPNHRSERRFP